MSLLTSDQRAKAREVVRAQVARYSYSIGGSDDVLELRRSYADALRAVLALIDADEAADTFPPLRIGHPGAPL